MCVCVCVVLCCVWDSDGRGRGCGDRFWGQSSVKSSVGTGAGVDKAESGQGEEARQPLLKTGAVGTGRQNGRQVALRLMCWAGALGATWQRMATGAAVKWAETEMGKSPVNYNPGSDTLPTT